MIYIFLVWQFSLILKDDREGNQETQWKAGGRQCLQQSVCTQQMHSFPFQSIAFTPVCVIKQLRLEAYDNARLNFLFLP